MFDIYFNVRGYTGYLGQLLYILLYLSVGLQGGQKLVHHFCTPSRYQILTDFQIFFTVRIRRYGIIDFGQETVVSWHKAMPILIMCKYNL